MAHAIASCKPVPDGLSMFMHHGVMVGVPTSDFPIPIASRGTPPQAPFGLELGIPGPSMAVHASGKKEKTGFSQRRHDVDRSSLSFLSV